MNEILQKMAREYLKRELAKVTQSQLQLFRQMYAFGKNELSLDGVIDTMPEDKLDWAMMQVKCTVEKNSGSYTLSILRHHSTRFGSQPKGLDLLPVQRQSFQRWAGGILVVSANTIWLGQVIYYRRLGVTNGEK